jgi:hypothetical protein
MNDPGKRLLHCLAADGALLERTIDAGAQLRQIEWLSAGVAFYHVRHYELGGFEGRKAL